MHKKKKKTSYGKKKSNTTGGVFNHPFSFELPQTPPLPTFERTNKLGNDLHTLHVTRQAVLTVCREMIKTNHKKMCMCLGKRVLGRVREYARKTKSRMYST